MTKMQKNAISSPSTGLILYQVDENPGFYYFDGTSWIFLIGTNSSSASSGSNTNTLIYTVDGF
jgi:hypothetical protein